MRKLLLALTLSTTLAHANTIDVISTGTKTWFLNTTNGPIYHTTPYTMHFIFNSDLWQTQPIPSCPTCGPEAHYVIGGLISATLNIEGMIYTDPHSSAWLTWNDLTGTIYAGTDHTDFYLDSPSGSFQLFRCPSASLPCGLGTPPATNTQTTMTTAPLHSPGPIAGSLGSILRAIISFQNF